MRRLVALVVIVSFLLGTLVLGIAFGAHAKHHRACSTRWPNAVCRQHRGTR